MIAVGDGKTFLPPPLVEIRLTPAEPLYTIFPFILEPQGIPEPIKTTTAART
jgi:hypothetical protein